MAPKTRSRRTSKENEPPTTKRLKAADGSTVVVAGAIETPSASSSSSCLRGIAPTVVFRNRKHRQLFLTLTPFGTVPWIVKLMFEYSQDELGTLEHTTVFEDAMQRYLGLVVTTDELWFGRRRFDPFEERFSETDEMHPVWSELLAKSFYAAPTTDATLVYGRETEGSERVPFVVSDMKQPPPRQLCDEAFYFKLIFPGSTDVTQMGEMKAHTMAACRPRADVVFAIEEREGELRAVTANSSEKSNTFLEPDTILERSHAPGFDPIDLRYVLALVPYRGAILAIMSPFRSCYLITFVGTVFYAKLLPFREREPPPFTYYRSSFVHRDWLFVVSTLAAASTADIIISHTSIRGLDAVLASMPQQREQDKNKDDAVLKDASCPTSA